MAVSGGLSLSGLMACGCCCSSLLRSNTAIGAVEACDAAPAAGSCCIGAKGDALLSSRKASNCIVSRMASHPTNNKHIINIVKNSL